MIKVNPFSCLPLMIGLLISSQVVQAEVYRWVDENGKVHFTDKPPKQVKKKSKVVDVDHNRLYTSFRLPDVASLKPIKNLTASDTRTVKLEKVTIDYQGDVEAENAFGQIHKFSRSASKKIRELRRNDKPPTATYSCKKEGKLTHENAKYILGNSKYEKPFNEAFEKNGYSVPAKQTFALQEISVNDLSLAALVTDFRLSYCGAWKTPDLKSFTQNATYLKVEWKVFDNLSRKVVFETITEGKEDSFKSPARYKGAVESAGLAFQQATEHLLAQPEFIDLLKESVVVTAGYRGDNIKIDDLKIEHGNQTTDFVANTRLIEKAAVTIRVAGGHGSGFVVSSPGYILTNQHVVGDNSEVVVDLDGKEHRARVLRSHPGRDVALLKLEGSTDVQALQIDSNEVMLGEEIYVVGTPLDIKLDFSISRGIISARRTMDDQSFYQTDAAVNPGNSGGPVFNKSGNVIGMTVSGLFSSYGASKNINYVIPILDALKALDLEVPRI